MFPGIPQHGGPGKRTTEATELLFTSRMQRHLQLVSINPYTFRA
jgi:hypothetical protein